MNSPTSATTVSKKPHVLINRNFTLLWIGQAISFTGDFVFDTVLILWIATSIARGQSWAPLAVSAVVFMAALPAFVVAPFAGVLVDSWDNKRKTMLYMHSVGIVLVLLLFPLTGLVPFVPLPFAPGILSVWWKLGAIYAVALLIGTMAQFFNPAEIALLSDIVEEPEITRATGLHSLTLNLATLLGPAIGALLYFAVGVQSVLLLNMLSFVVAFLAILAIRIPAHATIEGSVQVLQHNSFLQNLMEGLRFFGSSRILVSLIVSGVLLEFNGTIRNTLGVFFVVQNLHADASLYGLLGTAFGAGLIIGAAVTSYVAQHIGRAQIYWFSEIAVGILMLMYARVTSYVPALVLMFIQGFCGSGTEVLMIALVMQVTPRDFVGRVLAVFTLAYGLVWLISTLLAGYLASVLLHNLHAVFLGMIFGPVDTVFTAVGLMAIIGGMYAMVTLRRLP